MNEVEQAFVAEARRLLLSEYLPKVERCVEHLTDEQVWRRDGEHSNSVGNLLLHLAGNARQWVVSGLGRVTDRRLRDTEFEARETMTRDQLLAELRGTLAEVDGVLSRLDTSTLLERRRIQGRDVTVLVALFHVVEHFSMHTGQIILLTKSITGRDLSFYDFSGGAPRPNWNRKQSAQSGSQ